MRAHKRTHISLTFIIKHTHTHTHAHPFTHKERERERQTHTNTQSLRTVLNKKTLAHILITYSSTERNTLVHIYSHSLFK